MPMTADEILTLVSDRTPNCAKVGVFDVDGIFRGKYLAADKLGSALKKASASATSCLAGIPTTSFTTTCPSPAGTPPIPTAEARLLPETMRTLPFEGGMPLVLGEFSGRAEAVCPRGVLRRVLDRAPLKAGQ
jgi:glutamine synthetase